MRRRRRLAALGACALVLAAGLDARLRTVTYPVVSDKVTERVTLAVLTDLHSCGYGKGQSALLDAASARSPDAVLLAGDIVDDKLPEENAWTAVSALAAAYPTFYVTGNHEYWSGEADRICGEMKALGVTVLRGETARISVRGQTLLLGGVDDPEFGDGGQLERIGGTLDGEVFSILLAHRPEEIRRYLEYPFDLVVSGHAHGGQWRIPRVLNGLLAPNQGLLPQYAGGRYDFDGTVFLVSRGLARESTKVPRLFNRPELVIVDIAPEGA